MSKQQEERRLFPFSGFSESILKVNYLKEKDLIRVTLILRKYLRTILNPSSPRLAPPENFLPQFFSLRGPELLPRSPPRDNEREKA